MVQGEEVYKGKPRVFKYGMKAYAKMRGFTGKRALKEVERLKKLYPTAPVSLEPKAPHRSRTMRSYWEDVKLIVKGHETSIKEARKILKREKEGDRRVRVKVMVIKKGKSWQLMVKGAYKNKETSETAIEEGASYLKKSRDEYEEAFEECIKDALNRLGSAIFGDGYADIEDSDWELTKVLKKTWIRYYGKEPTEMEGEHI